MTNYRVIFAGTPEFAVASLQALIDSGAVPSAVLTQPDRPAGRGKSLTASPVKKLAEAHGIRVMQPLHLRDEDTVAELRELQPDIMVVAAYGLILPQAANSTRHTTSGLPQRTRIALAALAWCRACSGGRARG